MKTGNYNDGKFINKDTYLYYANTNEIHLTLPLKGIVVEFPGLDGGSCLGGSRTRGNYSTKQAIDFGENGILVAFIFPGPWSWGTIGAVRIADAVVTAIASKYNLGENFPVAVCGGSMGGLGAINYAVNSKYNMRTVAVACPCVDVIDRLYCHPDFPRTYISAVASYDMELEEALKNISPINLVSDMPDTMYYICSNAEDEVFPEEQCDLYVEALKQAGYNVEYHKQPNTKHGEFLPDIREKLHEAIENAILK